MRAFPGFPRQKPRGFVWALCFGGLAASLALASPAHAAGGGGGGGGGLGGGGGVGAHHQAQHLGDVPSDVTVCKPPQGWDKRCRKCLVPLVDAPPGPAMSQYAY